jgi:hypothetical protein
MRVAIVVFSASAIPLAIIQITTAQTGPRQ